MTSVALLSLITWITTLSCFTFSNGQLLPPTLSLESDGRPLSNPASVRNETDVTFRCSVTKPQISVYRVTVRSNSSSQWVEEAQCLYSGGEPIATILKGNVGGAIVGGKGSITCLDDVMSFVLRLQLNMPRDYDCVVTNVLNQEFVVSPALILRSYTIPTGPVITMDPKPLQEGEEVTLSCVSAAKPPPKLFFYLGNLEIPQASSNPPINTISNDTDYQQSVLQWKPVADKKMHNQKLICRTKEHLYEAQVSTSEDVTVIYGPITSGSTEDVSHNINSGAPPPLECSMEANPAIAQYSWKLPGNSDVLAEGQKLTIPKDLYENKEYPLTLVFECTGTNPESGKTATEKYSIVLTGAGPNGSDRGSSTSGDSVLEPWHIAIIVVGIVVVLFLLIITIVCCVRRNKKSPAKKAKEIQARRTSDERNDDHSMSKYQGSTSSLARQSDHRMANYHENPTLPADYRYSQDNVEQYAEVIDDMPRSRKPIALEDMDRLDDMGPPQFGEAPPAYSSGSLSPYGVRPDGYNTPSYDSYMYGAAC